MIKVYKKEEFIQAMKNTIKKYAEDIDGYCKSGTFDSCYLCHVAGVSSSGSTDGCQKCPWVIINKEKCYNSYLTHIKKIDRIAQLIDWIKNYEDAEELPEFKPFTVDLVINSVEEMEFWYSVTGNSNNIKSPGTASIYRAIKEKSKELNINVKCYNQINPLSAPNYWETYLQLKKEKV